MYCFRCGKKLPGREINCPDCDTPKKRRQRKHKRMLLGLFIFLSGAMVGSLFDKYIFKTEGWNHSILGNLFSNESKKNQTSSSQTNKTIPEVKMQYSNNTQQSNYTEKKIEKNVSDSNIYSEEKIDLNNNLNKEIPNEVEDTSNTLQGTNLDTNLLPENDTSSIKSAEINNYENPKEEYTVTSINDIKAINPLDISTHDNTEASSSESQNNEQDETIIVEKLDDGNTETATEPNEETNSISSNESTQESNENTEIPLKGNLVYKNISILEDATNNRDSYHGFVSKNGQELVFSSNRLDYKGKPTYQCFIKSPNPSAKASKAFDWKGNIWTPELTPDSNMIVFSSDSAGQEHIFLYDRKSGNNLQLTSGKSKDMMPSISPDGKKIAFVSNRSGKNCIYVCDLFNTSKITQVTTAKVDDREPRWTKDGKSIIFTRILEKMKVSNIMKVNLDQISEPVALVSDKSRNWMADLSPDGSILAFTRSLSNNGSRNVIVLKDMKSGKEEVLNFSGISESMRPVWNTDCSGFVFHIRKSSASSIYKANFSRE